jgi:hypothetical protein
MRCYETSALAGVAARRTHACNCIAFVDTFHDKFVLMAALKQVLTKPQRSLKLTGPVRQVGRQVQGIGIRRILGYKA